MCLAPPGSQCNLLTFQDAEELGWGYYPVHVGTSNDFSEQIKWFKSEAVKLKAHYDEKLPKLCATQVLMKNETAYSQMEQLTSLFNFVTNSERKRELDTTKWKFCLTKQETLEAIAETDIIDTGSEVAFKQSDFRGSELDEFAKLVLVRKTSTKKTVVFVETDFSSPVSGCSQSSTDDIVPLFSPAVFEKSETEATVYIRMKQDVEDENEECVQLKITAPASKKGRRKRSLTGSPKSSVSAVFRTVSGGIQSIVTPNGLENCNSWYEFVEAIPNAGAHNNKPEQEKNAILKQMTENIMKLFKSFSEASLPLDHFRLFRKTSTEELYSVFYGGVHYLKKFNPLKEVWFSTSLNHPRLFFNGDEKVKKDRETDLILMVYHVNFERFKKNFADRIIEQAHAAAYPTDKKKPDIANLKNYVHRELLESDRPTAKGNKKASINHPWSKFNFALRGENSRLIQ